MDAAKRVSDANAADAASVAECRALLERVLANKLLNRSERQREFLSYICERALTEPDRPIRETDIGHNVFGRPLDYDTSQDNIVRVNASELRHRLQEYFSTTGSSEPVVIELPRGGYRARFVRRPVTADLAPAPPPSEPSVTRSRRQAVWIVPAACFLAGAVLVWLATRGIERGNVAAAEPAVLSFWSGMFSADRQTHIIMADSCLSLYQDLTGQTLTLDDYLKRSYLTNPPGNSGISKTYLEMLMSRRYTSVADAEFLNRISQVADRIHRQPFQVYFARDYPAESLRNSNVVIIGSHQANPWAEAFESSLYFRVERDNRTGISVIRNPNPQPGEQAEYHQAGGAADVAESHGVIALLPNGQNGRVLLLAGTGMDSTKAAGEFLTSEHWISELKSRLGVSGPNIPYFEALIYTKRLGSSAIDTIAIRAVRRH